MSRRIAEAWIQGDVYPFRMRYSRSFISGYSSMPTFDDEAAQKTVLLHAAEARAKRINFFHGRIDRVIDDFGGAIDAASEGGDYVYFIGRSSPVEVCSLAELGWSSLNRSSLEALRQDPATAKWLRESRLEQSGVFGPDPAVLRRRVRRILGNLYRRHRFTIEYLDKRGLRARFIEKVAKADGKGVARELLAVSPDAARVARPLSLENYILRNQAFVLWWE